MTADSRDNKRTLIAELLAGALQDLGKADTAASDAPHRQAHPSVAASDLLLEAERKSLMKRLEGALFVSIGCQDTEGLPIPSSRPQSPRATAMTSCTDTSNDWEVALEEWDGYAGSIDPLGQ